ncbi:MAG: hypothetical protein H6760_04330 [Candidatus Nomurabacteria bacterium]|nr:MAG: hypothetical protein H6760_04330 [Candidatus Nomurabacteria bacterium]
MYGKLQKIQIAILIAVFVTVLSFPARPVFAANLTSISDTLNTLTQAVDANHEIYFVTPTGVDASTDTITIDFTDFTTTSVAFGDIDLAVDDDAACDGSWSDKTLAASAAAGTWGAAIASDVLTLTPPTDASSGEITAGRCVQIQIGSNASGGSNQINNPNDTSTHVVEIAGNFGDSGKFALDFVGDDSVNVTATVDPSITFAISDTTVGFGTLSSSAATYATGDTNGSSSDSADAHTLAVSTNATDGWAITYNGATLTSGSDTISVASINNDANGTPGSEEFGLSITTDGDATIATGYAHGDPDWTFVASTTTTIISETVPTNTETIGVRYLANIAAITEAGLYTTDITYIATATF